MAVSVMIRAIADRSGSWSWFGLRIGSGLRAKAERAARRSGSGWPVGGRRVWPASRLVVMAGAVGRLGGHGDRVGSGQAEFGGPALDVRPEPVSLVQIGCGGGVGQDHRGDRAVAVEDLAGEPG